MCLGGGISRLLLLDGIDVLGGWVERVGLVLYDMCIG